MIEIEKSAVINRPVEEVFAYVTDVENEPQWISEVAEVRKTSDGPMGVGSTYDNIVHFLGRRIVDPHEVIQYERWQTELKQLLWPRMLAWENLNEFARNLNRWRKSDIRG